MTGFVGVPQKQQVKETSVVSQPIGFVFKVRINFVEKLFINHKIIKIIDFF